MRHLLATSCSNGTAAREVGGYIYIYIPAIRGLPR